MGGRSQDFSGYTLNRAFQSYRQPGSAIKPLIVYTPSFERNYTPDSVVTDEPIEDGPRNANGSYSGQITVRTAVEKSVNTIAWKLYEELTPEVGLSYLEKIPFNNNRKYVSTYFLHAILYYTCPVINSLRLQLLHQYLQKQRLHLPFLLP